jgi:hypothetical protein
MTDWIIEILKIITPVILAYIGVLKTRAELDIAYSKIRKLEGMKCQGSGLIRKRWYHKLKSNRGARRHDDTTKTDSELDDEES